MLKRVFLLIAALLCAFGISAYYYQESQIQAVCPKYIDFVRPKDGLWNTTPMTTGSYLQWKSKYSLDKVKLLKPREIDGYKVLASEDGLLSLNLYSQKNTVQNRKKVSWLERAYERMYSTKSDHITRWDLLTSSLKFANELSTLDCPDIAYPSSLSLGFKGLEIILDEKAKKILTINSLDGEGKEVYDGMLIFIDRENIVSIWAAGKDKDLVKATLVETAKIIQ